MYRIEFTSAAARQVRKLDRPVRTRLLDAIETLASSPRPDGVKKLASTENAWRIRVGDYRIIYSIEDDVLVVTVVRVAHRREAYRSQRHLPSRSWIGGRGACIALIGAS